MDEVADEGQADKKETKNVRLLLLAFNFSIFSNLWFFASNFYRKSRFRLSVTVSKFCKKTFKLPDRTTE